LLSVYDLKPAFQSLLRPTVKNLAARGITANQVTVSAALLSLLGGVVIALAPSASFPFCLLPLLLFIRMALNAIDGMLAREHAQQSKLGAILNELGDVLSDTFLYLPLALVPGVSPALMIGVVILAIVSEMTGGVAIQIGAKRQYKGPMGKSDRALWLGAFSVALALGYREPFWMNAFLALVFLLLMLTIYNRAATALHEVADAG
jgi:CDP-diacylglycerol--glycerol-3-phosphate 3-phosphatidyltransferase